MFPERDTLRWPGKARDQNVTKAGGVIVAWLWRDVLKLLLGDSRKFVASS